MRIHRLIIEGIGPYAERQELDFDELTAGGLFLLTGPTGAGKTTVLDAVVFALYGTVPGARGGDGKRDTRRARERIVSDLRDLDTQPKVELEFSAAGRRFIVIRSPDHERPKTRGEGTTVAKAAASLEERVDGDWVPRSTDFFEISTELQEVLGMNAEQFAQVVLLPQGEFAGFLRASVADRRRVLERLFQVDRYQSAEEWFRARAETAKTTLAEARSDLALVVERLAGALGDAAGPDEVRRELSAPDHIAAWVAARREETDARLVTAEADAARRKAEHAAIDEAHVRAAQIADLHDALAHREEALAEHAARLPKARRWMAGAVDAATARYDAAWEPAARAARGRAAELVGRLADERRLPVLATEAAAADRAADEAETAASRADAAVDEARRAVDPERAVAEDGARAEAAAGGLRRELDGLTARIDAGRRRDALARQSDDAATKRDAAAAELERVERALAEQPTEDDLDGRSRAIDQAGRHLGQAQAQLEADVQQSIRDLDRVGRDRETFEQLRREHGERLVVARAAQEAHLGARTAYLAAREARLDAMAAELAAGLQAGEACPVCGSADHPAPADGPGGHDLRAAEAAAEAAVGERERERAEAQGALDTCAGRLAAFDADELERRTTTIEEHARSRHGALEQLRGEQTTLAAERAAVDVEITARRTAARAVGAAQATLAERDREANGFREALASAAAQAGDGPLPTTADVEQLAGQLSAVDAKVAAAAAARDRIAALEAEAERQRSLGTRSRATVARERESARGLRAEGARLDAELAALRGSQPSVEAAAAAAADHARNLEAAVALLDDHRTALVERDTVARQLADITDRDVAAGTLRSEDPADVHERVRFRAARRSASADLATDAFAELREAKRCRTAVADAEASLEHALAALGPAAEAAERLIRLDATVRGGGDNLRKISLATYVLAARLEEVAAAATGHLLRMSSGRYELLHHDDRYGGGPAGLGLRVRDGWTGEERDTATLSGGEAFYASLALALGLAEVVTGEAGGRPLDTLLVDEGFGSLDADTLEEVLGELDQLRAAGRSIGLVSHVPALAERIPSQLRVEPGRGGSTARVVVGATV